MLYERTLLAKLNINTKMADEDEVDVLSDFSLDNLLSKNGTGIYDHSVLSSQNSELLSCDYSLHPQWLLDNPTNHSDCWYTSTTNDFTTEDGNSETNTSLGFDEVICTENKTTDECAWTEEEKVSLLKGLEIFGKNSIHLSQCIGSKTASQVKHYLKLYHNKSGTSGYSFSNIYNTVEINEKQVKNSKNSTNGIPSVFKMADIIEDAEIPASIEEVIAAVSTAKPTVQNLCTKKSVTPKKKLCNSTKQQSQHHILKFGQSLYNLSKKKPTHARHSKKVVRKRLKGEKNTVKIENEVNVIKNCPPIFQPVSSCEELIKIKKENTESESDIDIDIDIDEDSECVLKKEVIDIKEEPKQEEDNQDIAEETSVDECSLLSNRLKNISESILNILTSTEVPSSEVVLDENVISDLEKCVHSEFFEGRPTKTSNRYLKIRNHIIDFWLESKPMYCTKTSVRQGLKNCGDVNCIGRVHQFLEQIGAINFGCDQTNYVRPLLSMMTTAPAKEKTVPIHKQKVDLMRKRMKKKYNNDGEGGYTMMHDENGEIIDTTIVNQDNKTKSRTNRRQNIKLVYCKTFADEESAPFKVKLHISALLVIDIHAHSALIEVMGLLGGFFDQIGRTLHITRYIPCRGIDHSNTHCDMCPVSQSEASEMLQDEGVEVIGWFHSHPTFFPNPSFQDIATQLSMQQYLSNVNKPFVGVILSPFRVLAHTLVSDYRCLVVDKTENDSVGTPYKFQVNLVTADFNVDTFLKYVTDMFAAEHNIPKEYIVDFCKPYVHDISLTYLEKLLASIKLHLARCSEINKMTCDAIVQGVTDICLSNNTQ